MATNNESRITSTQGKEAIYQAHLSKEAIAKIKDKGFDSLESSASEIDGSTTHPSINSFLYKINKKIDNVSIFINSDSTGNATTEWVYYFAEWLAVEHPYYTVRWRLWDDSVDDYASPISLNVGTGIYFIDVWNFAVSGSKTIYCLGEGKYESGVEAIINPNIYADASSTVDLCIINHGHNVWTANRDYGNSLIHGEFTETFLLTHPFSSLLGIRQNPWRDNYDNRGRIESAVKWAGTKGYAVANVWDKFEALNKDTSLYADNIHPSLGLGTEASPTGTRLFLNAVTEVLDKPYSFNTRKFKSIFLDVGISINSNFDLEHLDGDEVVPTGYTVVGGTATKDITESIDIKKGYSTLITADGGTPCYLNWAAPVSKLANKRLVLAVRMKTENITGSTYGRVGLYTNNDRSVEPIQGETNGVWHWRFVPIQMRDDENYLFGRIFVDTANSIVAGTKINIDKIIVFEGDLPAGSAI